MSPPTTATSPALPTLDAGLTLLASDATTTGALQSLVLDHVLTATERSACWIDGHGDARTTTLARLAPHPRVLDRIAVARGFTAYQHHSLVERLVERVATGPAEPSLIVVPAIDWQYRNDDPQGLAPQVMLTRSLDRLAALAAAHETPVLVTRTTADGFSEPVATAADTTVRCEQTQFGPRFTGDGIETRVYPTADGTVQTTLAFWQDVLAARAPTRPDPCVGTTPPSALTTPRGHNGVTDRGAD